MRYPVVLFDVGQTLIGPRRSYGAVYGEVLAGLGLELEEEALETGIRQTSAEMLAEIPPGRDRFSHYPGGEAEFWGRFARRSISIASGRDVGNAFVLAVLDGLRNAFKNADVWKVFDDVRPTLDALRADGVRLGVVSNWDSRLPTILRALELDDYFEEVGVSQHEGCEKPDPRLFRCVLDRMGAEPSTALHVGDVPELDREGARAAGVDALIIDRDRSLPAADDVIASLEEIPARVRA